MFLLQFADCLGSQQHASVSQRRICSDKFTPDLTQSQYYNGRYAKPKQNKNQKKKKKKKRRRKKADLTTVLHIGELPHLHMKVAVWLSIPTTNNKNPMIPSCSLVSIYNYSFHPDQIFTKNFENLELEICSNFFYMWNDIPEVNSSLPTSLKKYVLSH